jgi:hypothetical protein
MTRLVCKFDRVVECPDIWSNIRVSVRVFWTDLC